MSTHNDIHCSIKMLVCLLSVLSLVMVFCGGYELDNCTLEAVKHPLYFLGFFPCSPDSNKDINECDMLTLSAVELAIDKINQDPNILSCFKLELLPVFTNEVNIFKLLKSSSQTLNTVSIQSIISNVAYNLCHTIYYSCSGSLI